MKNAQKERFKEMIDIVMSHDADRHDVWHALIAIKQILKSKPDFIKELFPMMDMDALLEGIKIITMHHKIIPQRYIDAGIDDWNDLLKDIRSKLN